MLVKHNAPPHPPGQSPDDQGVSNSLGVSNNEGSAPGAGWIPRVKRWTPWDWFALVLPILALSPLLAVGAKMLWNKQHMQFFPLAIVAVCLFVAHEGIASRAAPSRVALAKAGAWTNLLLVAVASLIHSSWLAHITSVSALLVWMVGKFGNLSIIRMLGISGLALITVPFPFNGDQELVRALQRISSFACSRMMDALGILHVRMGNVLELAEKQLLVEEACSGVDSQYALMAVAGVLLLIGRASLWVSIVTIVTVPIWAILGNILRIFSIVIGVEYFGIDLSTGWQHTLLGLIAFAMAAWAHWSSVQFLNWLEWTFTTQTRLVPQSQPTEKNITSTSSVSGAPAVSRFGLSIACSLLLFIPASLIFISSTIFRNTVPYLNETWIAKLPGENSKLIAALDARDASFDTVRRFQGHQEGQCSRVWRFTRGDCMQTLSIDLPFRGGHPLWVCYSGTGWTLSSEMSVELYSQRLDSTWPVKELLMRGPEGQWATLHFIHVDLSGKPFDNNTTRLVDSIADRESRTRWSSEFLRSLRNKFVLLPAKRDILPITVQFQLLTQLPDVPSADRILESRKRFQVCREQFLREMEPVFVEMRTAFE